MSRITGFASGIELVTLLESGAIQGVVYNLVSPEQ